VPIIFAIGKKEMSENTVSVRRIGNNENQVLDLDNAINEIVQENRA
jgi:threonyl-tRNA synthetase